MKKTTTLLGIAILAGALLATPSDRVKGVLEGLAPADAISHGNLTVFPLYGPATGERDYVTLDKAIKKGYVEVQEKDGGEVNTVRVKNKSDRYVFGMAGEIITGAKQNRMLQRDVMIHPKSGWLDLSVYCVEHGRWAGSSMEFGSKSQIAAGRVRGKAANSQSQSGVWAEVDANNADIGIAPATGRFDAVYDDEKVQKKVAEYRGRLETAVPTLADNVLGVAVAVGDRIVCVDAFSSPSLFRKMWPRLLESYVIDAVSRTPSGKTTKGEVEDFIRDAASAAVIYEPTVGGGQALRIDGVETTGSALVSGKEVVHLDLFPAEEGDSDSSPLQLDIRRSGSGVRD